MKRKLLTFLCAFLLVALSLCMLTACGCDHVDKDDNGKCDECGKKYRDGRDLPKEPDCEHRDADDDNACDICGESFSDGEDVLKTYKRCDKNGVPSENGEYVLFGEYPQTLKAADVTVGTQMDSRGYFRGSDGFYYAKVTATPHGTHGYAFSTGDAITGGAEYYFKVEPIRWRILKIDGAMAMLLCDSIIANMPYDTGSDNNYKNSDIRYFLNVDFFDLAFNSQQKLMMSQITVDNSVASTGSANNTYACENTVDQLFLLSFAEVKDETYGFASSASTKDAARRLLTSDYARATGVQMQADGSGRWWLRSPYIFYNIARCVEDSGVAGQNYDVGGVGIGLVPAVWVTLQ